MSDGTIPGEATPSAGGPADWPRIEQEIRRALREVRFGSIEITIHNSRVVQIERREKTRLAAT